jgi:trk system potassium uptake protein TrkH
MNVDPVIDATAPRPTRPPASPVASLAPGARARAGQAQRARIVLGALLLVLLVDFAFPIRRVLSPILLAATSGLAFPWARSVLRGGGAGPAVSQSLEAWAFRLSVLALAAIVLAARWWLSFESAGAEPQQFIGSARSYVVALGLVFALGSLGSGLRLARFLALVSDHPARLIVLSFGATGVLGGLVLSLPVSLQRVHELSLIDNLFMAFSAVCVTGLSVNNLAATYTWFGQGVLCLLIQVGGLGIMVLSAAIAFLTGQRLRARSHAVFAEMVDADSVAHLRRVILGIVASTLVIEALLGLVLYQRFSAVEVPLNPAIPANPQAAVAWAAVFHAVSGFCNAGLSSFEAGLVPFVGDPVVMLSMTCLILLGGIGFPVLHELMGRLWRTLRRQRRERLSLHARIALGSTALLFVGVTAAYLVLEWRSALAGLGWHERVLAAVFHSASCRTAGFSVIDVGAMRPASLMLTCVAMFIGACPGSCAGGIKTTTVAVLFAGLRSELQGRPAYLLDRELSLATTRKAVGVAFSSFCLLSGLLFLLLLLEKHAPLAVAFEVFSAFSTTGLSTGITPQLSVPGEVLVLLTMYIGRIGPLTLALAISGRAKASRLALPSERVLIG